MATPRRRRGPAPLSPDLENQDPFRRLPHDFPSSHSRFPLIPSHGYGDFSFDPEVVQTTRTDGLTFGMTSEEKAVWRDAMARAIGAIVPPSTDDDSRD